MISEFVEYVKQAWKNKPNVSSPLNADRLNHMEAGIENNSKKIKETVTAVNELTENKTLTKSDVFDEYSNIGDFYAVKVGSIIIVQRCTFASKSYTPSIVMAKLKSSYKPLKSMRIPVQLADLENVALSYLFINEKGEVVSANTFASNVFCCQFILA